MNVRDLSERARRLGLTSRVRPGASPLEAAFEELRAAEIEIQTRAARLGKLEASFASERDQYRDLLEFTPMPLLVTNKFGTIRECNQQAAELLRARTTTLVGKPLTVFVAVPDRDDFRRHLDRLRAAAAVRLCDWRVTLRRSDGKEFPASLAVTIQRSLNREAVLRWAVRDVSEQILLEEEARAHRAELAHALRLASLGEMVASLAHELNQPVSAIAAYAGGSFQRVRSGAAVDLVPVLEKIEQQARRSGEIIQRVKQFLAKGETRNECFDLNQLSRAARDLVVPEMREQGHAVRLELADALPVLRGDPIQVEQVIVNLLRNALEALPLKSRPAEEVQIRTRRIEGAVECTVLDYGKGVAAALAEQIFEPFVSTKPGGLGMGLAISRSIVAAHGGRLWLEQAADGGTAFRFRIPCEPAAAAAEPHPARARSTNRGARAETVREVDRRERNRALPMAGSDTPTADGERQLGARPSCANGAKSRQRKRRTSTEPLMRQALESASLDRRSARSSRRESRRTR